MKKKLLVLSLLIFTGLQAIAQCERTGSFIQSDPQYSISGNAKILFLEDRTKQVVFESNFNSVQGADLRVFVSTTQDIRANGAIIAEVTKSQLVSDDGTTSPPLRPLTGMKTFDYPSEATIEDYQYIVIQCVSIDEPWGYVNLSDSTPDCATLSTNKNTLNQNITLLPNPASEQFEVRNNTKAPISITLYNVLGKKVQFLENTSLKNQFISLVGLNSGVYLVEIFSGKQRITKKLIKH